jgi:WD40 repeat protein
LTGSDGGVEEVAYARGGSALASAGSDGLRLWDTATDQPRSFQADRGLMSVAFAPDGATLAAADRAGHVLIYDAASGVRRAIIPVGAGELNALVFAPDGSFLAAAGRSGTIHIVDPHTGDVWPGLEVSGAQVNGLAFSPDGSILASCSHDGGVRLWRGGAETVGESTPSRNRPASGSAPSTGSDLQPVRSPPGKRVATADSDRAAAWVTKPSKPSLERARPAAPRAGKP